MKPINSTKNAIKLINNSKNKLNSEIIYNFYCFSNAHQKGTPYRYENLLYTLRLPPPHLIEKRKFKKTLTNLTRCWLPQNYGQNGPIPQFLKIFSKKILFRK